MRLFFFILLCLTFTCIKAQEESLKFRNPDSLMMVLQKRMPFYEYAEFKKAYDETNDGGKELLLYVNLVPKSSKVKLIENLELNKDKIFVLVTRFKELVPAGYRADINFSQTLKFMDVPGIIEIKIYKDNAEEEYDLLKSDSKLAYGSKKLSQILNYLNWTDDTLQEIEELLKDARCVGISNRLSDCITVDFSQSGLGMYSYLIFPEELSMSEIDQYNDGCTHIFYKDNIVLEFSSGATGQSCFEKIKK